MIFMHELQVDELKTIPNEPQESAPTLAAKALDQELGAASSAAAPAPQAVNDLTSIVKKKKKPVAEANGSEPSSNTGKRKAEDDVPESASEKKAKMGSEQ